MTSQAFLVGEKKETQVSTVAEQRWGKCSLCHLLGRSWRTSQYWLLISTRLSLDKPEQKLLLGWWGCNSETWQLASTRGSKEHRAQLSHRQPSSSALHSCSYNCIVIFCLPCQNILDVLQMTHGNAIPVLEMLQLRDINYINS